MNTGAEKTSQSSSKRATRRWPVRRNSSGGNLGAARFTAIGAFQDATIGYFDWQTKEYRKIPVREQVEVLSLEATRAQDGEPKLHAHVVLGRSDGTTRGGHLLEAHARATSSGMMLVESPKHLHQKKHHPSRAGDRFAGRVASRRCYSRNRGTRRHGSAAIGHEDGALVGRSPEPPPGSVGRRRMPSPGWGRRLAWWGGAATDWEAAARCRGPGGRAPVLPADVSDAQAVEAAARLEQASAGSIGPTTPCFPSSRWSSK